MSLKIIALFLTVLVVKHCNAASNSGPSELKRASADIIITNRCPYTVWVGTLTGGGKPQLRTTGFELARGASRRIVTPTSWTGRFWGRTGCAWRGGRFQCETADCGSGKVECHGAGGAPPATLAELFVAPDRGQDFYDISNVDGFNVPMGMRPRGGHGDCRPTNCGANINAACPAALRFSRGGRTVGCKSACLAFGQPRYCCTGAFNTRPKCPPTDYSRFFKRQCPQAYSYAYDDPSSTYTCFNAHSYDVIFCP